MKKFITTLLIVCAVCSTAAAQQDTTKTSKRLSRIDRGINENKFVFKGESMVGLTVSYGTLESEDSDIALIVDNINLRGSMFSIKPHYGFFYRDNHAIVLDWVTATPTESWVMQALTWARQTTSTSQ